MLGNNHYIKKETIDTPKMVEYRHHHLYQETFCYGIALGTNDKHKDVILALIVAGNDSSLQALKASMDIGSNGISFGYGIKTDSCYKFHSEIRNLKTEKGKYSRFPLPIEGENNFKAMVMMHDDVISNSGDYILSFNNDIAEDILNYFGGSKYGLHLLPEWKDALYSILKSEGYLHIIPMYLTDGISMSLFQINITEEEADQLITNGIKDNIFKFPPDAGTGENIKAIDTLENYLTTNVDSMMTKINNQVSPTHDPIKDKSYDFNYVRELFPVQAHVATALVKTLKKQKCVLLEGEMSTGKTTMMTSVADVYAKIHKRRGFFSCVMVPPNLTKKWPQEIKSILTNAEVHVINHSSQLINYHTEWIQRGRPKPNKPIFFVISYNTMRDGSSIVPAANFQYKTTSYSIKNGLEPYKYGWYCPHCGKPHQKIISSNTIYDEDGNPKKEEEKVILSESEFGTTRRVHNTKFPANAFCSECGESLWTRKVVNQYSGFKDWTKYGKKLVHALKQTNSKTLVKQIRQTQKPLKKSRKHPRKVAAIEYIKRKMKNFFDLTIVDEIHLMKGGNTAQGNALGSLAAASKKLIGGTGTLFGGKAEDVYYILWRLFPYMMIKNGYEYSEVNKWNHEYGNVESTTINYSGSSTGNEFSNKNSHGGNTRSTEKVIPGISPFVYGKFLIQNSCLVRLVDVWPDPVELIDVPTILVPMNEELKNAYINMVSTFKSQIDKRKDGKKLYLPLTQNGVSYPDNPFTYPDIYYKLNGEKKRIWESIHLDEKLLLNKEKKLQEIVEDEIAEGRKSIIYVRDTGASVEGKDIRPRLKEVLTTIGAKVCILDTSTTETNNRSEWLENKIVNEDYDVCIVSQELVKVGLDLLCTPTLIFYQFSWSLFTINQASKRSWRIGQTEECRLYYLAYDNCYQEQMANLIAKKQKATAAINGDVSSDGLSAMLGDEGDLQAALVKSIEEGEVIQGSAEEWVSQMSDRARELLSGIGKKKHQSLEKQLFNWIEKTIITESTKNILTNKLDVISACIKKGTISGFSFNKGVLTVDLINAFGIDIIDEQSILKHLLPPLEKAEETVTNTFYLNKQVSIITVAEENKKRNKKSPVKGQLGFDLFAL